MRCLLAAANIDAENLEPIAITSVARMYLYCKRRTFMTYSIYDACIQACLKCAVACDTCAASCLAEDDVKMMARCIQTDIDCADMCRLAAALMARESEFAKSFCSLCAKACRACAEECKKHEADHCQECANACLACAEECERMAA